MSLQRYSISKAQHIKRLFSPERKQTVFIFISFLCIFVLSFFILSTESVNASAIQNDKLMERISNDYTNKFCNSIAFGLSKDSAMAFANKENNIIFRKKKGMDNLNRESTANKIAVSVVETCGYLINLKGEEGIEKFQKDYILMNENN